MTPESVAGQTKSSPAGPNAAQIEYWNAIGGPKWVGVGGVIDSRLAPVQERLLAVAGIRVGECVLDVGCGMGATTLAAAERVGMEGRVVGCDISVPMLEAAQTRARERGLANVRLVQADAGLHPFSPASFDRIVSRFGVMFFADPAAAFQNLYAAMRQGGHLAFVCWAPLAENPFWRIPLEIAERAFGPRDPEPEGAPGPFALSEPGYIRSILSAAGFDRVRIATEAIPLAGGPPDEEAGFACRMGPAARLIEQRNPPAAAREAIRREIAASFPPFGSAGGTKLPAIVHLVVAERAE